MRSVAERQREPSAMCLGLEAVALDPLLDVVGLEAKMTADPVVGDRVAVTARRSPIDERLRYPEDGCDLFDVQVARIDGEFKLLRRLFFVSSHASTSTEGK